MRTIREQFWSNPRKKRPLRSRSLRNVKAEGLSSPDDVSNSTETNHELRSAEVVAQSSHHPKARSASGARPSISFPTMQVVCHQHTCRSRAFDHVSGPLLPTNRRIGTFVSRDIAHKSLGVILSEEESEEDTMRTKLPD
ncbi:uncharacterized protein LOC105427600 [Pogonomyrmex barbatus]|uniref:Uncharacterized protein LOC105427600 n=1 Tax=Pogonomyrmex barbatus TaxID=144034 RepID=A0A6I9X0C3_9HYME|nr:uncharacterized protein LOC105427600 [Pogonomyrmex barbatus]